MIARLELEEVEYLIDLVIYHQYTDKFLRDLGVATPRPSRLSEATLLALRAAKNSKYELSAPAEEKK